MVDEFELLDELLDELLVLLLKPDDRLLLLLADEPEAAVLGPVGLAVLLLLVATVGLLLVFEGV